MSYYCPHGIPFSFPLLKALCANKFAPAQISHLKWTWQTLTKGMENFGISDGKAVTAFSSIGKVGGSRAILSQENLGRVRCNL